MRLELVGLVPARRQRAWRRWRQRPEPGPRLELRRGAAVATGRTPRSSVQLGSPSTATSPGAAARITASTALDPTGRSRQRGGGDRRRCRRNGGRGCRRRRAARRGDRRGRAGNASAGSCASRWAASASGLTTRWSSNWRNVTFTPNSPDIACATWVRKSESNPSSRKVGAGVGLGQAPSRTGLCEDVDDGRPELAPTRAAGGAGLGHGEVSFGNRSSGNGAGIGRRCAETCVVAVRGRCRGRIDPVPLALERVSGQRARAAAPPARASAASRVSRRAATVPGGVQQFEGSARSRRPCRAARRTAGRGRGIPVLTRQRAKHAARARLRAGPVAARCGAAGRPPRTAPARAGAGPSMRVGRLLAR